jgi:anti-anti-sigma factor
MQLESEVVGDVGVIRIDGDVDDITVPKLDQATHGLLSDGARSLVIDCAALTFIDSTGLSALISAHREARLQCGTVTIRNPSPMVIRLLEITGLDNELTIDRAGG